MSCFKGIDTLSAMKIHVTVSDFQRFPTAKAFMANLGNASRRRIRARRRYSNTPITKMGNAMVRKTLVECTQALVRGTVGKKSKALKKRQKGQEDEIVAYADKAVERLQKRFRRMVLRGKPYNVAIMAVARELAGFIWGMETGRI
ncbi:MAG: transposase [Thomasclavelia sp.]